MQMSELLFQGFSGSDDVEKTVHSYLADGFIPNLLKPLICWRSLTVSGRAFN
jgi:hypothetical protein